MAFGSEVAGKVGSSPGLPGKGAGDDGPKVRPILAGEGAAVDRGMTKKRRWVLPVGLPPAIPSAGALWALQEMEGMTNADTD